MSTLAERIEATMKLAAIHEHDAKAWRIILSDVREIERRVEQSHQIERARARQGEHYVKILGGIHNLLLSPDTVIDGVRWQFSPPPELALELLRGLGDRIRAIPQEIDAAILSRTSEKEST